MPANASMKLTLPFDPAKLGNVLIWTKIKMADLSFTTIISWLASGFMIFGGVIPYIPQYSQIKSSKNAEGFSLFVCFTLLVANTLRIFFWFGHRFEIPLLVQSMVMICTMFIMIHLCTRVKRGTEIVAGRPKHFTDAQDSLSNTDKKYSSKTPHTFVDFDWSFFWNWTDFTSYLQCMLLLSLVVGLVTMAFLSMPIYVETLGLMAVLFEALLGAPQFYANFQNKSTRGMSVQMVMLWLAGDIFKTVYFVARDAPTQFWLCGMLQISLDIAILLQVLIYGSGSGPGRVAAQ